MSGRLAAFLAAAAVALGVAVAAPAAAGEAIRVGGSGTWLGTFRRLGDAFERTGAGVRVEVVPSIGTSGGIVAVQKRALDLGVAGRALDAREAGLGLRAVALGRTPFVLMVASETPARSLSTAELVRILRGEVTRWPDGRRLRLVLRPASDADTRLVRAESPALGEAMDAALRREGMLVAATNQESHDLVRRTPGAIGFSSVAQLRTDAPGLEALALDGVEPTLAHLADGSYPLAKDCLLVVRAGARPAVQRFLAFVQSPAGRRVLEDAGVLVAPAEAGGGAR